MKPLLVIQQAAHEDAAVFAGTASGLGVTVEVVRTWLGEKVPVDPDKHSSLLLMGGPMNVDQTGEYPFLADEIELLRACRERGTPVLGVCLGAQLIAAAFGARVYHGPLTEIGWHPLSLTPESEHDPLLTGFPRELTVFQWHSQTFDLPRGAVRLAGSADFPNQAFRLGDRIWGLQFHLETTAAHVREWLELGKEDYAGKEYIDPRRVIEQTPVYEPLCRELAERLFTGFIRIAGDM